MILDSKQTTVAYRCPACGSGVMSAVGLFALSADRLKLRCSEPDCPMHAHNTPSAQDATGNGEGAGASRKGNDELDIVYLKDGNGRVRLSVPCIFCGKPHTFTINSQLFFGRDTFMLSCPYSGINICFMGEENHVRAELARSELELLQMLEDNGIDSFSELASDEEALPDPQIFDIIMFVIHELEAEDKIYCDCADGDGDYGAEMTASGIRVFCRGCGAERVIPTDSLLGAHDFLNCDSLHLMQPGRE